MEASIWKKEKIAENKKKIKDLFVRCYGREIGNCKFDQIYEENPCGNPKSVALTKSKKIIGFYGLIPQKLSKLKGGIKRSKSYLLGVSLMVSPQFRGVKGLQYIMNKANEYLSKTKYPFILGFPNEYSYLPLTRIFKWRLLEEAKVHEVDVKNDVEDRKIKEGREFIDLKKEWSFPYDETKFVKWKEKCNNYKFVSIDNKLEVVYKEYKNRIDVVDAYAKSKLDSAKKWINLIVEKENLNGFIISSYHANNIGLDLSECQMWSEDKIRLCVMGGRVGADDIHMSLLMSDVF